MHTLARTNPVDVHTRLEKYPWRTPHTDTLLPGTTSSLRYNHASVLRLCAIHNVDTALLFDEKKHVVSHCTEMATYSFHSTAVPVIP